MEEQLRLAPLHMDSMMEPSVAEPDLGGACSSPPGLRTERRRVASDGVLMAAHPRPTRPSLSPRVTLFRLLDAPPRAPTHSPSCADASAAPPPLSVLQFPAVVSERTPLTMSAPVSHRYARAPHLWALGVGAVISGDFFGWQSAMIAGFDGLLIILSVVTVLYVLLAFSIAELSSTVPAGGGPYVFALHGIGRKAAFFAGIAESLKVVVTCAVIVTGIGSYLTQLLGTSDDLVPIWWALFYVLFCGLNVLGVVLSFRIQLITTVLSVLLLLVFYVGAATKVSYQEWVVDQNWEFNGGADGILRGFSFSLWFYLGIEELPLAVEETIEPERNMPRGLISSILSLVVFSYCTVIFNSMISPGAAAIAASGSPLLDGYKSVFGDNSTTSGFTWLLIVGLIASFHSFIFCMGKLLYAIARDGFMPKILTALDSKRDTPYVSFIAGSAIGLVLAILLHYIIGDVRLGSVLINIALIGALVSYTFQLTAFIMLRHREPSRHRPYKSPFGVWGAYLCLALCAFVLFTIVYSGAKDSDFFASIAVALVYFFLGGVYFWYAVDSSAGSHLLLDPETGMPSTPAKMNESLLTPQGPKV